MSRKKSHLIDNNQTKMFVVTDFLLHQDVACTGNKKKVSFVIRGQPTPWLRPISRKTKIGKIYHFNPNKAAQEAMRDAITEYLEKNKEASQDMYPFFGAGIPVKATFNFLLGRPDSHFHGTTRIAGEIKEDFISKKHFMAPDVDNLVKFVLDKPMKGIFFADDCQVSIMNVSKSYDVLETCKGHIEIVLEQDE